MNDIVEATKKFSYGQSEKFGVPSVFQLELSNRKGQELAGKLKANKDIVLLGTLLMDCMLGNALKEGRLQDHVEMSAIEADKLLTELKMPGQDKENVMQCVRQHHGVKKFFSLESEICCNADCYRFASVEGLLGSIHHMRTMPVNELVKLFSVKADEKWNATTLDICRVELKPQYEAIKTLLGSFSK